MLSLVPLLLGHAVQAQSGPDSVGQWSPIYNWPNAATHANLLADGRVLTWFTGDTYYPGANEADIVTIPANGAPGNFTAADNRSSNMFCSGHTFLPNGDLVVIGGRSGQEAHGHSDVNVFDPSSGSWRTLTYPAAYARWYASAVTLADGNLLFLAGNRQGAKDPNTLPQIWHEDGSLADLGGAVRKVENYSMTFVAPDGRVFLAGPNASSSFLDTDGAGSWTAGPKHLYGKRASGTAVMYDTGKILVTAGGTNGKTPLNTAETIDLNDVRPVWKSTGFMAYARRHANATVLPDGKVLITGGSSSKDNNNAAGAILPAELWDPTTGSWKQMASLSQPRIYHSMAILLPDGRVLVGGGSVPSNSRVKNYSNVQIYSPPYLFRGERPTIAAMDASVAHPGDQIALTVPGAEDIAKVSLIRNSSVTHSFNMNQRLAFLEFAASGSTVTVTLPASSSRVPPGDYMLFVVDVAGVPSIARMLRVL
ncbi:MAG: galactose oxidase-like domain-containing protein [Geminicoccaceae bacterium]